MLQVYYSTNPQQPLSQWESQFVDNNKLTTISDLTPHTIYTIRVEAYTSIGPGPLSNPVKVRMEDPQWIRRQLVSGDSNPPPPWMDQDPAVIRSSFLTIYVPLIYMAPYV